MMKYYSNQIRTNVIVGLLLLLFSTSAHAQINFTQSVLDFNGNGSVAEGVTALMYGPDGRLYVAEYRGEIKILTIQRNTALDYEVTSMETLNGIVTMQDHDDDGALNNETERETTGIYVTGTIANPIIYVSSSDIRIGAGDGGGNGDVGLDTNSGVITRFTWNGSSWNVVDIVRGLPRSEENHATNGLEFATINGTDYLLVAQGGHTNGGSPSTNFVYLCEYALSAAVLSIDLDAINAMPVLSDNGRSYIYDIPTLDDPSRANVNGITDPNTSGYDGIDVNDPFGGNDGLNQAIVVPGGPVQIFSPGYRNAYDLVVTQSGSLYVTDNGANQDWGGFPVNEGGGTVTNDYDPLEPGSSSASGGEAINNEDHLQLVTTDLQNYIPGSFYGGHPNPIRANPNGAGLYVAPNANGNAGAVFRTQKYDPNQSTTGSTNNATIALPANWPPVSTANAVEGDWRGPGITNPDGPDDNPVTIWGTNTNGLAEYTASNFGGLMQGNLLASHSGGNIRRVELNAGGTQQNLNQTFLSGIGGITLGITCNSDTEIFPGTIWTGTLNGKIVVFEPADAVVCIEPGETGYDANTDYDSDGYTNQDEEDNDTEACNGGSQPDDFDKVTGGSLVSNLNDNDDDADGITDALDPFQLGDPTLTGSDAFTLPIRNDLFNDQQGFGGVFGLGMTGLMNNGDTGANWLEWIDRRDDPADPNPNDVLGGAPGLMTSHMTSGTALGTANNQEKAYQLGVQTSIADGNFEVIGNLIDLSGPLNLYGNTAAVGGELGHFIGDGTQSNYMKIVLTTSGITALQEINDVPQTPINIPISVANRPTTGIVFYFVVNTTNGDVGLEYVIDGGSRNTIGTITAQGSILSAIQQANQDLAVGFIGTSNTNGVELAGTWDFLNVLNEEPVVIEQLPDLTRLINSSNEVIDLDQFFDDNNGVANLTYTIVSSSNPSIGGTITANNLTLSYPAVSGVSNFTIRATDADTFYVEQSFTVTVTDMPIVLYRVNSGGPQITAIDGSLNWDADTSNANSTYLTVTGSNSVYVSTALSVDASVNQTTTPLDIYATERYDSGSGAPNLTYSFPVSQSGNYEVRLYMGNSYSGTSQAGERVFDAEIEGVVLPLLNGIDLSDTYGDQTGTVVSHILKITDGVIDVSFVHGAAENPIINAIEILDAPNDDTPIYVNTIENQYNSPGEQLNGSLGVNAFGGDGNLQYSGTGFPAGVVIEPTNGQIGGTINAAAATNSPYTVTITVNDGDGTQADAVSTSFVWVVGSNIWVDKNENENYTPRHECSIVQAGDKFYLMGGRESAKTVDVYDYTTNTWANLADSAPFEFNHFQAVEYQGLIWVIGAFKNNSFPNELPADFIWMFDPATQEWMQGPAIPSARKRGSTGLAVYNDKFYVVGGNTDGHDGGYVPWFDVYDPGTGVWTPLTDAPRARDHFGASVIGNNLYVVGGRLSGGTGGVFAPTIAEVDVYNFTSGTWSTLPSAQNIPTPRGGVAVATFNEKLVVVGGEVENEVVYGVLTTDALKITEQYDPATQLWTRISDLNSERHGTQAIVSGNGLYVFAGSPAKGSGNQKNMEYLGEDNPVGSPSVSSVLSAPANVLIGNSATEEITLSVGNGNVGVFVTSMQLSGTNAADFNIISGELTNQLINAFASHDIQVTLNGTGANRSAILTINYGNGNSVAINLANFDNNLNITNPGTQNNNEGDVVSLQIQANGVSTYSATGLPPTLTIDANTGLISGTVSTGGASSGPFEEQGGLIVIESESESLVPTWVQTTAGGATGIVAGSNHFSNQNGGTIPYQITVTTPGVYRFNWRNFYSGSVATDENDTWLKFPNTNDVWFFGFKGTPTDEASLITNIQSANPTNVVFPIGSTRVTAGTTPNGNGSNGYFKIFRSGGTSQVYDWQAKTSDNDSHDIYVYFVNAGTYTMNISERSAGHAIDKVALYKVDGTNYSTAQLTAATESQRTSGTGAADGSPYNVTVSIADNGVPASSTNTQFTWYIGEAGDPVANATATPTTGFIPLDVAFTGSSSTDDVGITSYLWDFKDGTATVTQADPMHTFTSSGTYEVELTVGDVDGNTSTTTITITATDPAAAGDIRINAGGPSLTNNGTNWFMDQSFVGGTVYENPIAIANTANDELYQTERYSNSGTLIYQIPVTAGNYNVNLHFAELYFGAPGSGNTGGIGSRVFNVNIENGQEQLNNYDIILEAGASATAVIESFENIAVNDGTLTITLTSVTEQPKISAIEVIVPGNSTAPNVFAGDDRTSTIPNTSLTLDGSAVDPDGGIIALYAWTQISGPNTAIFDSNSIEDPEVSGLVVGDYVFRLTATDDENETAFDEVTITIAGEPGSLLINSGGPDLTFGTEEWTADQHFMGGGIYEKIVDIANTTNDALYQTERYGTTGELVYEIPVSESGEYNVDLHFAELYFGLPGLGVSGGVGSRVFNINIENGQVQSNNYDIFSSASGAAIAIVETFKAISVTDGSLTITLTGVVENPKLSGIGVFETRVPEVDAGIDSEMTLPTNEVTLNGTASDPDGGAISIFQWTQVSGPNTATLVGDTSLDLVVTNLIEGAYVFRLTATDDEVQVGYDEIEVTVLPGSGNQGPTAVAEATPLTGTVPLIVAFTGSNSTDDVGVVTYTWDFKDGLTSTDTNPSHTFTVAGTYDVELTVTDAENLTNIDIVTIVVSAVGNEAPIAVASATPISGNAPLEVSFTGSNSTDDVGIESYVWDFKDGETSTEMNLSHTFTTVGTYDVELIVTDAGGLRDTTIVTITVSNGELNAVISDDPERSGDTAPIVVAFNGEESTGDIVSYLWNFDDGSTSEEENPEHRFDIPGEYTITLTVEDANGVIDEDSYVLVVEKGDQVDVIFESNPTSSTEGVVTILIINKPESVSVVGVTLHDIGGRLISSYLGDEIKDGDNYNLPIANLENGVYLVRVMLSEGESTLIKLLVGN